MAGKVLVVVVAVAMVVAVVMVGGSKAASCHRPAGHNPRRHRPPLLSPKCIPCFNAGSATNTSLLPSTLRWRWPLPNCCRAIQLG